MQPLFSICLIARNESSTLPRLAESLKDFQGRGGEVILVDTGSTDNTAELARSFNFNVTEVGDKFVSVIDEKLASQINSKFIVNNEQQILVAGDKLFDFASARNFSASLASNNMISFMDADEAFTRLNIDVLNKLINDGYNQFEYNFVFAHDEYGNEAVKFIQSKFYDRRLMEWKGVVHECLFGESTKKLLLIEEIFKLEHWQNRITIRAGYLKGLAVDCFNNPNNDRNSHYFAREMLWTGRPCSALKEFERHIEMKKWPAERAQSMIYIGDCYGLLNKPELQVEWYNKGFYLDSTRREALIKLARFYKHNNNPQATACYATAALQIPWNGYYANESSQYTFEPHELLYWAKGWMGDITGAKEHITKALGYKPLCSDYLRDLRYYFKLPTVSIVIPTNNERPEGLNKCIESVYKLNYPKELVDIIIESGPETVPVKVKLGVEKSKAEYVAYMADDAEFYPDTLIIAIWESLTTGKGLIAFDTGVRNSDGFINEHFLFRLSLLDKIDGEIFDTEFHHVGVDDLLWRKCNKLGEAMISKAQLIHKHFSRIGSGVVADNTIKKGWSHSDEDRELLKKKIAQLNANS